MIFGLHQVFDDTITETRSDHSRFASVGKRDGAEKEGARTQYAVRFRQRLIDVGYMLEHFAVDVQIKASICKTEGLNVFMSNTWMHTTLFRGWQKFAANKTRTEYVLKTLSKRRNAFASVNVDVGATLAHEIGQRI